MYESTNDPSFQAILQRSALAESEELTDSLLIEVLKWKKDKTGLNQQMIDMAVSIALIKARTILCPTREINTAQIQLDL